MLTPDRLILGDCLIEMDHIAPASIDLVLTDLPFGTTRAHWDTPIDLPTLWTHYRRICKPTAAILLFAQTPFDKTLGCSNLEWLRYEWIWHKTHPTGHLNAKRAPMKAHENVLVFYAKQPTYNPQKTTGHVRKTATKRRDITAVYGAQTFDALPYDSTERYPRSVLTFPSDKQRSKLSSTQKPLDLCRYLIRTYSNPGETVLDSCAGSGTTCLAARLEGRRYIGIEKDAVEWAKAQLRLDGALKEAA